MITNQYESYTLCKESKANFKIIEFEKNDIRYVMRQKQSQRQKMKTKNKRKKQIIKAENKSRE